jgi:hypothetical protein
MKKSKKFLLLALILVIATGFSSFQKVYLNKEYNISLKYPDTWTSQLGYLNKFAGKDGFFQIDALGGGEDFLDAAAKIEAYQRLQPYGSSPTIDKIIVDGEDARLILPSKDQLPEMKGQGAIIVKYPREIKIASENYRYLILWADKEHIKEIVNSLKFIKK